METGTNDRRDFLNRLVTAALMAGLASEAVNAQQTPTGAQSGGNAGGALRQAAARSIHGDGRGIRSANNSAGWAPIAAPHAFGFVLGYVIEGDYLFAINNETPRVVHAGEIFYEPPGAMHTTHAAAKPDQTVKLLAIVSARRAPRPRLSSVKIPEVKENSHVQSICRYRRHFFVRP